MTPYGKPALEEHVDPIDGAHPEEEGGDPEATVPQGPPQDLLS